MYVRYPALDLLGIIALESVRAKAYVVGEDLGTVEDEVRRELAFRKMLSYRVLWFESGGPETYPKQALASVTTHDLPTIAGLLSGSDLATQRALHLAPNEKGTRALIGKLAKMTGTSRGAPIDEVIERPTAPSRARRRAFNGDARRRTGGARTPQHARDDREYPCWSIPLPRSLEEMKRDPRCGRSPRR